MSYKNLPLAIFWYFAAVVLVYHCAKIHSLSSRNKLSKEMSVFGLSRFLANFSFFERMKDCAFISWKLNKLRRPFFTFPDNFTHSILIAKNIPPGVKVRGLQRPQIGLRGQNFKIDTFSRGSCDQTVRPRGSVLVLFCTPEGPLVNDLTRF